MITEEALKEFEKLWQEDHPNEKIGKEELLEVATRVLRIVEILYRQIPIEKLKK